MKATFQIQVQVPPTQAETMHDLLTTEDYSNVLDVFAGVLAGFGLHADVQVVYDCTLDENWEP